MLYALQMLNKYCSAYTHRTTIKYYYKMQVVSKSICPKIRIRLADIKWFRGLHAICKRSGEWRIVQAGGL